MIELQIILSSLNKYTWFFFSFHELYKNPDCKTSILNSRIFTQEPNTFLISEYSDKVENQKKR